MFDTNVVKLKAGYVGQITRNDKIVWESTPYPSEMVEVDDKLRRQTERDIGWDKAFQATQAKIDEAVERLFA